jgi:hypothetical protein
VILSKQANIIKGNKKMANPLRMDMMKGVVELEDVN